MNICGLNQLANKLILANAKMKIGMFKRKTQMTQKRVSGKRTVSRLVSVSLKYICIYIHTQYSDCFTIMILLGLITIHLYILDFGLSTASIIGIVVGVVVLIAIIAIVAVLVVKKKRKNGNSPNHKIGANV